MSEEIEKLKEKILPILKEAGVLRSSVFGSVARGDNRPDSDVDILVEIKRPYGLFELIGLQQRLEDALEKKVDLVPYNSIKPRIKDRIIKEQVPIL